MAMSVTSSAVGSPAVRMSFWRSGPWTSSITRNTWSPAAPTSYVATTFGWDSRAAACASAWNRWTASIGSPSRLLRSLTATCRARTVSSASQTSPAPPLPSKDTNRYRPASTSPFTNHTFRSGPQHLRREARDDRVRGRNLQKAFRNLCRLRSEYYGVSHEAIDTRPGRGRPRRRDADHFDGVRNARPAPEAGGDVRVHAHP